MSRTLKVYQGEDSSPVIDVTEPSSNVHVIWEEVEAGHRAYKGESSLSSFPMRDERGETGSGTALPSGLTQTSLSAGSRIEWKVNDTRLFRGRIGPKDYSRGRQKADRAREVVVSAQDINYDLRNIIVDGWSRPEETDVARVQALVTAYLAGSPRATTSLSTTYVAAGSNTVTVGAKVYDATDPATILGEIAQIANKLHFVTIDDELFYDGWDSTAYQSGIRISDRIDEISTGGTCADFAPTVEHAEYISQGTSAGALTVPVTTNGILVVIAAWDGDTLPYTATWTHNSTPYALTAVPGGEIGTAGAGGLKAFYMLNPPADPTASDNLLSALDNLSGGTWKGYFVLSNVSQSNPFGDVATASGSSTGASVTIDESTGAAYLNSVFAIGTGLADPTPASGQTQGWAFNQNTGMGDAEFGGGYGDSTPAWTLSSSKNWVSIGLAVRPTSSGGAAASTFPPIWDVGAASTEDGMQLLSGLRLYYGQGSNTYVYVNDPVTANSYWHSEQSLYTSDPLVDTAAKATTLANAILHRRKYEERTYNVSIGPLNEEQLDCLKPGQLINIKARAIPDADDAFVARRIAQLRWTTPVPGSYFAHMQLDRPMKEAPYGVGPKSATDSINRHVEQGSNSHPEYVLRGTLITQGDLPYRGASDWTRLGIGASNTQLSSDGIRPLWTPKEAGGAGADEKAKVSANDTTAGYLNGKLVAGTGITLTENSDGGNETLTIAASGGGGWTANLDLDGTTFTGLTSVNGTWASTGTVIQQTDGTSASRHARVTNVDLVPLGLPVIMQVEVRAPSSGQSTNANMTAGLYMHDNDSVSAAVAVGIRVDNGATNGRFIADNDGIAALDSATGLTIAYDTWYTVRLCRNGNHFTAYLDGTLRLNGFQLAGSGTVMDHLGLWTAFGMKADFRNFKIWTPTQP